MNENVGNDANGDGPRAFAMPIVTGISTSTRGMAPEQVLVETDSRQNE
jgi:hypothetical protein